MKTALSLWIAALVLIPSVRAQADVTAPVNFIAYVVSIDGSKAKIRFNGHEAKVPLTSFAQKPKSGENATVFLEPDAYLEMKKTILSKGRSTASEE